MARAGLLFSWTLFLGGCASGAAGRVESAVQGAGAKPRPLPAESIGRTAESSDSELGAALSEAQAQPSAERFAKVGALYADLGVRDTALGYFSKSLALDARYLPALDGSARLWRDAGYPQQALTAAYRATYFAPNSAAAWNTLGTVLQTLDLVSEAAAVYRRALALDESAAYARNNLCYLAFLSGDHEAAVAECTAALAMDRTFTPAANNLALVQAVQGHADLAFVTFASAGGTASAHFNVGLIRLAQHQYAAAVTAFEAAYGAEPNFDLARERARAARRMQLRAEKQNGQLRR